MLQLEDMKATNDKHIVSVRENTVLDRVIGTCVLTLKVKNLEIFQLIERVGSYRPMMADC